MNLLDNIIWYLILAIILATAANYISWLVNISYRTQSNFLSTSILENTEKTLFSTLWNISIDKNKNNFQEEYKSKFLDEAFWWIWVDLRGNHREWSEFICYNYFLEDTFLSLHRQIDITNEIDFYWEYYLTDEDGFNSGSEFLNIICLYNTFEYIWSSDIIDTASSPINYVLYTLYNDLKLWNEILEKKWTIYFN